jgi:hypothetical protein
LHEHLRDAARLVLRLSIVVRDLEAKVGRAAQVTRPPANG